MIHREAWYREALEEELRRKERGIQEDPETYLAQLVRSGRPLKEFLDRPYDEQGHLESLESRDARRVLLLDFLRKGLLPGADLRGIRLNRFVSFQGANLQGVNLQRADLRGIDFRGVDFRDADLSGANLSGTDLSGAKLQGANLQGVDFADTEVEQADFRGAQFDLRALRKAKGEYIGEREHKKGTRAEFKKFLETYTYALLGSIPVWSEEMVGEGVPEWDRQGFDAGMITPQAEEEIRSDCLSFFDEAYELIQGDLDQAGYDFYLTRNGHGAGFWDGDWGEPAGTDLTDMSYPYGSQDLMPIYMGDDEYGDPEWTLEVTG